MSTDRKNKKKNKSMTRIGECTFEKMFIILCNKLIKIAKGRKENSGEVVLLLWTFFGIRCILTF
jgi:hypothetical protein